MSFPRHFRRFAFGVLLVAAAAFICLPRASKRSPAEKGSLPTSRPATALTRDGAPTQELEIPARPQNTDDLDSVQTKSARVFATTLSLALSSPASDSEERETRISLALTAWASEDFVGASSWARTTTVLPRAKAIAAVVNGVAVTDRDCAIRYVEQLSAEDAEHVTEYGSDLIFALGQSGNAATAAQWAEENKIVNLDWLTGAFERWGAVESESALLHALAMSDPVRRRAAVDAAISGWSKTEPKSLADYAAQFPDGPEKNLAVVTALRAWAEMDAKATADWMLAHRGALANVPNLATINED